MDDIRVNVAAATPTGRLYPRYDTECGILVAETEVLREWPFGLNIDNVLICDVEANTQLGSLELIWRKELWRLSYPLPDIPKAAAGDLYFTEEVLSAEFFDKEIDVLTDASRSVALITIGAPRVFEEAVELSSGCTALLAHGCLVGFRVLVP